MFKKLMKDKAKDFVEQRKIKNLMDGYLSKDDLKKLSKKLHVKTSGNKGELIKRILNSPDFNLDVLQKTFTKTELKKISSQLKQTTTGSEKELWNKILVKKGIIVEKQELSEFQDKKLPLKNEIVKSTVRKPTAVSSKLQSTKRREKMNFREFMRKYLTSYDLRKLVNKFRLNPDETRAQLIDQLASNPDFELNDLIHVIGKDRIQKICRELSLRVSGSKEELWKSIVTTLNLEQGKELNSSRSQISKTEISTFMLKYLTKEYIKEILSEYPIKQTGRKEELVDRLVADPEFDSHDIYFVLDIWFMREISQKLRLSISGNKEAQWERILQKLKTEKPQKEELIPQEVEVREKIVEDLKPSNDMTSIIQIIQDWIPSKIHRYEEGYQSELAGLLEHKYNFKIQQEAGKNQVDILVENMIPIELKKNPKKDEYDRLTGQVIRFINEYNKLIIIIFKPQNRDLFVEYRNSLQELFQKEQLAIISK